VTEVTLKSAFLFNFARFTEWPAETLPAEATVSACVLGDQAVGDALARAVKGKQIAGRPVAVTNIAAGASLPPCHVLYLSGADHAAIGSVMAALRNRPVLTVSDAEAFTKRGGIIQFFVEGGKMRFRINTRSARRARLLLSSRLLALAEVVEEDPISVATVPLEPVQAVRHPELAPGRDLVYAGTAPPFTTWKRD
jgi:hypothetical protein